MWVQGHLKRSDINSEHLIFHWKALATTNEITPNVVLGQENPNESPLESANQNQLNQESLSNPNSSIENSPTQTKTEPVDDESARRNQGKIRVHEIYIFNEEVAFLGSIDVGDGYFEMKYVGEKFELLVTDLAVVVTNSLYISKIRRAPMSHFFRMIDFWDSHERVTNIFSEVEYDSKYGTNVDYLSIYQGYNQAATYKPVTNQSTTPLATSSAISSSSYPVSSTPLELNQAVSSHSAYTTQSTPNSSLFR